MTLITYRENSPTAEFYTSHKIHYEAPRAQVPKSLKELVKETGYFGRKPVCLPTALSEVQGITARHEPQHENNRCEKRESQARIEISLFRHLNFEVGIG